MNLNVVTSTNMQQSTVNQGLNDLQIIVHNLSMFIRFSAGYSFRHKIILVGQTVDTLLTLMSNCQKTISASVKMKVSSCRFILIPAVPSRYLYRSFLSSYLTNDPCGLNVRAIKELDESFSTIYNTVYMVSRYLLSVSAPLHIVTC
jgi:hypothetical protein